MKKRNTFIFSLAILLIVIGSIGTVYFNRISEHLQITKQSKSYTPSKNKSLELDLPKGMSYSISSSPDEKIHIKSSLSPSIGSVSWSHTTENNNDRIIVQFKKNQEKSQPIFFSFTAKDNSIDLSIPKKMTNVKVLSDKSSIHVYDFDTPSLEFTGKDGDLSLSNIKSEKIIITNSKADIYLNDVTALQTISVKNINGNIYASETRGKELAVLSESGDIELTEIIGKLTVENKYGPIDIDDCRGPLKVTNQDGDINLAYDKFTDDITALSTYGNILLELPENIKNTEILTKSKYGEISLFDSNKKTFKQGKGSRKILLESTSGDIDVTSNYYDYEDLEEDFEHESLDSL